MPIQGTSREFEEGYYLQDAHQMNSMYPDTFHLPTEDAIARLREGSFVKLIFIPYRHKKNEPGGERMWVKITAIKKDRFTGVLDNDPLFIKSVKIGEIISFKADNIASIL